MLPFFGAPKIIRYNYVYFLKWSGGRRVRVGAVLVVISDADAGGGAG